MKKISLGRWVVGGLVRAGRGVSGWGGRGLEKEKKIYYESKFKIKENFGRGGDGGSHGGPSKCFFFTDHPNLKYIDICINIYIYIFFLGGRGGGGVDGRTQEQAQTDLPLQLLRT